jgi:glycosyltransferase involved in cell wall biosynthesis
MVGFIVPDLDGPVSGGTLFNRMLVSSLAAAGEHCKVLSPIAAISALAEGAASDTFWVDSLFLDHVAGLARAARGGARLGLLVHYLPSLVTHGDGVARGDLTPVEARALSSVDALLVPSRFMRSAVARLLDSPRPILELEPGRLATGLAGAPDAPVRAVMVANLLPGKGVLPFLRSLAGDSQTNDQFVLDVVGGDSFDCTYAGECRRVAGEVRLQGRVRLRGALSPDETIAQMAACNLCVSASTMESYGMVLAEARTLGLPILANPGGNVQTLVEAQAGGGVLPDAAELARAFLGLCRDPVEHGRRLHRARACPLPARPWAMVAAEFLRQTDLLSAVRRPSQSYTDVHRA